MELGQSHYSHLVCDNLIEAQLEARESRSTTDVDNILAALSATLRKLLRREQRVTFNGNLPTLVDSFENTISANDLDKKSVAFHFWGEED